MMHHAILLAKRQLLHTAGPCMHSQGHQGAPRLPQPTHLRERLRAGERERDLERAGERDLQQGSGRMHSGDVQALGKPWYTAAAPVGHMQCGSVANTVVRS